MSPHVAVAEPRPTSGRLVLLDAIRGYALVAMTVNHLPPSRVAELTYQTFGYVSMAEVFLFVSGFFAGRVYGRELTRSGPAGLWRRALRRVRDIYLTHLAVVAALVALVLAGVVAPRGGARLLGDQPAVAGLLALGFGYLPMFLAVLPMYCIFLLLAPAVLLAIRSGRGAVVAALSVGLWAAAQLGLGQLPVDPDGLNFGAFNLCAWQAVFLAGIGLGCRQPFGLESPRPGRPVVAAAILLVAVLFVLRHGGTFLGAVEDPLAPVQALVDRRRLGALRALDFAALAALVATLLVPRDVRLGRLLPVRALAFLGRHSLQVFAWSIVACYLAYSHEPAWAAAAEWARFGWVVLGAASLAVPAALHLAWRRRVPAAAGRPATVLVPGPVRVGARAVDPDRPRP